MTAPRVQHSFGRREIFAIFKSVCPLPVEWLSMATRNPMARGKRERERARAEKQKEKAARRAEARARRGGSDGSGSGEDPDIAGIVPGPQANPWGDSPGPPPEDAEDEETTDET